MNRYECSGCRLGRQVCGWEQGTAASTSANYNYYYCFISTRLYTSCTQMDGWINFALILYLKGTEAAQHCKTNSHFKI